MMEHLVLFKVLESSHINMSGSATVCRYAPGAATAAAIATAIATSTHV